MGCGASAERGQDQRQEKVAGPPPTSTSEDLTLLASLSGKDPAAPALGPPRSAGHRSLGELPKCLADLHNHMLPAMQRAPMRLLLLDAVLEWRTLKTYEEVSEHSECVAIPYCDAGDDVWQKTVAVSWRHCLPKPRPGSRRGAPAPGSAPLSERQFAELREMLRLHRLMDDASFVWIDVACVPQQADGGGVEGGTTAAMEAVRSKVYFARAHVMVVLPAFRALPESGPLGGVLESVHASLERRTAAGVAGSGGGGGARSGAANAALAAILAKNEVAGHEYFERVWAATERMARAGRGERLCNWLTLEAWLGMVIDALVHLGDRPRASSSGTAETSCSGTAAAAAAGGSGTAAGAGSGCSGAVMYRRALGRHASEQLEALLGPFCEVLQAADDHEGAKLLLSRSSRSLRLADGVAPRLAESLADLLEAAVYVWHSGGGAEEALPTRGWLDGYLKVDRTSELHQASHPADRVWAVYGLYCCDVPDMTSREGLQKALEALMAAAGGDRHKYLGGMVAQLSLQGSAGAAKEEQQGDLQEGQQGEEELRDEGWAQSLTQDMPAADEPGASFASGYED